LGAITFNENPLKKAKKHFAVTTSHSFDITIHVALTAKQDIKTNV
jgi:hypothetical protein